MVQTLLSGTILYRYKNQILKREPKHFLSLSIGGFFGFFVFFCMHYIAMLKICSVGIVGDFPHESRRSRAALPIALINVFMKFL